MGDDLKFSTDQLKDDEALRAQREAAALRESIASNTWRIPQDVTHWAIYCRTCGVAVQDGDGRRPPAGADDPFVQRHMASAASSTHDFQLVVFCSKP